LQLKEYATRADATTQLAASIPIYSEMMILVVIFLFTPSTSL